VHEWPARAEGVVGRSGAVFLRAERFRRGATSGSHRTAGRAAPRRPSAARRAWSPSGGSSGAASGSNSTAESCGGDRGRRAAPPPRRRAHKQRDAARHRVAVGLAEDGLRLRPRRARGLLARGRRGRGRGRGRRDADGRRARRRAEVVGLERGPRAGRHVEGVEARERPPQPRREAAGDDDGGPAPDARGAHGRVRPQDGRGAPERVPPPAVAVQRPERVVGGRGAGRRELRRRVDGVPGRAPGPAAVAEAREAADGLTRGHRIRRREAGRRRVLGRGAPPGCIGADGGDVAICAGREGREVVAAARDELRALGPMPRERGRGPDDRRRAVRDALRAAPPPRGIRRRARAPRVEDQVAVRARHDPAAPAARLAQRVVRVGPKNVVVVRGRAGELREEGGQLAGAQLGPVLAPERRDAGRRGPAAPAPHGRVLDGHVVRDRPEQLPRQRREAAAAHGAARRLARPPRRRCDGLRLAPRLLLLPGRRRLVGRQTWRRLAGLAAQAQGQAEGCHPFAASGFSAEQSGGLRIREGSSFLPLWLAGGLA